MPHKSARRALRSIGLAAVLSLAFAKPASAQPLLTNLTQEERAWLDDHKDSIVLGSDAQFAPMEFFDDRGVHSGMAADYCELIEQRLGIQFRIVRSPTFADLMISVRERRVDMVASMESNPDRERFLSFSAPYSHVPVVFVTRSDRPGQISVAQGCENCKVGVVALYAVHDQLKARKLNFSLVPVPDEVTGLRDVSFGRLDAIAINLATASYHIQKEGLGNLRVAGNVGPVNAVGFATRNDWPLLHSSIEKAIASISDDERTALREKWIRVKWEEYSLWADRRFWLAASGLLVLLLVAVGLAVSWNRTLRRQVDRRTSELAAAKLLTETILDNVYALVVLLDRQGTIVRVNRECERVTGWAAVELVGRPVWELIPDEHIAEFRHLFDNILAKDFPNSHENEWIRKNGDRRCIAWANSALLTSDGQVEYVVSIGTDTTERKLAATEKKQLESQLVQAQKMDAIGRLAGGVAHDFNNLLTAILGYCELLLDAEPEGSSISQDLGEIKHAANRAKDLTSQLLTFSRKQVATPKVLDLNASVLASQKLIPRLIGEEIQLEFALANGSIRVRLDPSQLDQVLVNLAINARDSMPQGGKLVIGTRAWRAQEASKATVPIMQPGNYALLEVSDTGCGMSADVKDRIFEPFFTTKEQGKGTGLGLSIVYGIVVQNQGCLAVSSEPGMGTTFRVYLPQVTESPADSPEPRRTSLYRGKETILLTEDDPTVRNVAKRILEAEGYALLLASNADEAIALFRDRQGCIDLLVTDVIMPGLNGKQLHARLQESLPNLKVLYISGYAANILAERDVLANGVQFLAKPFTRESLARSVRTTLDAP